MFSEITLSFLYSSAYITKIGAVVPSNASYFLLPDISYQVVLFGDALSNFRFDSMKQEGYVYFDKGVYQEENYSTQVSFFTKNNESTFRLDLISLSKSICLHFLKNQANGNE